MFNYKFSVILAIAALLVGGAIAFAQEIIIFEQTIGARPYWVNAEPSWNQPAFAQTFVSPATGALKKVDLKGCGSFKIHFYKIADAFTAPDFPTGAPIATYPINNFCSWDSFLTALTVTDGPVFTAGQAYAMAIESNNAIIIASDLPLSQDAYPSGTLMMYKNNSWVPLLNADLVTKIWDDPPPIPVKIIAIDVRPASDKDRIKSGSKGSVQVAVLSAADFSPLADIDQTSLTFGKSGNEKSLISCKAQLKPGKNAKEGGDAESGEKTRDFNKDGVLDLVCRFQISLTGLEPGDMEVILKGRTVSGSFFEGKSDLLTK